MNSLTISFIIFVGLLFAGIVILLYPTFFVPRLASNQMAAPTQPLAGTVVPREIIMFGSVLTITGLVGISILGFRIFTHSEGGEIRK